MTPPKPPTDNLFRGVRSGGYYRDADWVRAAFRFSFAPSDRYNSLGFRLTQRGCRMPLTKE